MSIINTVHVILFNKIRNTYHYALLINVTIINTRQEIIHILLVLNEAGMTYILRSRTQRLGVHSVIDGGGTRLETFIAHTESSSLLPAAATTSI